MKRIGILIILAITLHSCNLLSAAGITSGGQPTKQAPDKLTSSTANSVENVDHSTWDALLKKHVDANGMVDYKGFEKDRSKLNNYLEQLFGPHCCKSECTALVLTTVRSAPDCSIPSLGPPTIGYRTV